MNNHRYILEPYKGAHSRHKCPACSRLEFVRYIDSETGQYLADHVGRCNRESNCSYHYKPLQYFNDNVLPITHNGNSNKSYVNTKALPPSFIPENIMLSSLSGYENNCFVQFLESLFGIEIALQLTEKYKIGTSKHWNGATVFWQVDTNRKIRTGKIMLYNHSTGKRIKEPFNHITWAHKALKMDDFSLNQCFFGQHLLTSENIHIAIVESEKTAVIASVYFPQFTWIATGGLQNLTPEKCKILKGKKVILFPDLNAYEKWCDKAKDISSVIDVSVSDILEKKTAPEDKVMGYDIADFLINMNPDDFRVMKKDQPEKIHVLQNTTVNKNLIPTPVEPELNHFSFFANLPPLKPATGHIKLLEDEFFRNKKIPNREQNKSRIITLIDRSKRSIATDMEIKELENLIRQN